MVPAFFFLVIIWLSDSQTQGSLFLLLPEGTLKIVDYSDKLVFDKKKKMYLHTYVKEENKLHT